MNDVTVVDSAGRGSVKKIRSLSRSMRTLLTTSSTPGSWYHDDGSTRALAHIESVSYMVRMASHRRPGRLEYRL